MVASREWVEVILSSPVDAGDLLARLDDPTVAGAWQDNGRTRLYWPKDTWGPDCLEQIRQVLRQMGEERAGESVTVAAVPVQDWNEQWARSVRPIRIGRRIVIRPSWAPAGSHPGDIELILDPKQAFGTGHHATTALLLVWLQETIRGGEAVLDVGTGSGILAMAALRLGAGSALGIDNDPVAIDCARDSAAVNHFGPELDVRVATLERIGTVRADVILANLDRRTLLEAAPSLAPFLKRGARLLVSGILAEDRGDIADAFSKIGASIVGSKERDGWLALEIMMAEPCEGASE